MDVRSAAALWANLNHGVLGAVRIWFVYGAGGIVTPLAVDDEAVLVRAGSEFDGSAPDTGRFLFELNRLVLPLSEIASEHDGLGVGSGEGEDLLFALDLFCHRRSVLSAVLVVSRYSLIPKRG